MKASFGTLFCIAALIVIGCSNPSDSSTSGEKSTQLEVESELPHDLDKSRADELPLNVKNADSVLIGDGVGVHKMGALKYPLGQGGQFTGQPGPAIPAGPVIVYIFRNVSDEYLQSLTDLGVPAKNNSAYLWPESGAYDIESMKNAKYLRSIDPTLTDYELAAEFGLLMAD